MGRIQGNTSQRLLYGVIGGYGAPAVPADHTCGAGIAHATRVLAQDLGTSADTNHS